MLYVKKDNEFRVFSMAEIQEKYAEVNGLKMYYEEIGEGDPLILLHGGIGCSRQNWGPSYSLFSQHFKLIALDSRGHGKTDNPKKEFSYRLMCDDTVALIEELGLEKPLICGWSDGGQIALELGIEYPDTAKALVAGGVLSEITDHYIQGMKSFGMNGPGDFDFAKFQETLPEFMAALKDMHSPVYGEDYWKDLVKNISYMWMNPDEFPQERLRSIAVPTLIIQGDRDEAVPLVDAVNIYKMIPNAELAIVPGADHLSIISQAPRFAEIILEFLNRHKNDS